MSKGIAALASQLARHGRNGDTKLVHMNPDELAILEKLTGQKASTNPTTGQPEGFAFLIPLIMGLASAASGIASAKIAANAQKDAQAKQEEAMKAQQEADRRRAAEYAKDFVNIPTVERVRSPAPDLSRYTPGVDPEQMQIKDQITGYLKPTGGYAAGGQVEGVDAAQKVVAEAVAALMGKHPRPKKAIEAFVKMFGPDELEALEQEIQGGSGQDVGLLSGPGAGMDDQIPASVGGQRPVQLSDGEYVVPADAVSHLGDGSTKAGAQRLEQMVSRVRKAKTGKRQQPGAVNPSAVMPA